MLLTHDARRREALQDVRMVTSKKEPTLLLGSCEGFSSWHFSMFLTASCGFVFYPAESYGVCVQISFGVIWSSCQVGF